MNHEQNRPDCICDGCCEQRAREVKLEIAGRDIASRIADYINPIRSAKYFVAGMACQHRTLQAGFMRLVIAWIEHNAALADKPGFYDLRNEAAVKFAKAITETAAWEETKNVPYI